MKHRATSESLPLMAHILSTILTVLLTLSVSSDCWQYLIIPSSTDPCLTPPCLTLSQLASNTSSYLHSNTTLGFLSGNHTLDSDLTLKYMTLLQLLNTEHTRKVHIICEQSSRFDMYFINSVYMNGLEFIGCGGNSIELVGNLLIEHTSFHGQSNSGTALDIVNTVATIKRSSFKLNIVGTLKYIENNLLISNVGGAVIISHSAVTISNCTFEGNSAEVGGAIFGEANSSITIINSTYVDNHATCIQSSITCYGGALYTHRGGRVRIYNSVFKRNTVSITYGAYAFNCYGGAIAVVNGDGLYVSASELSYNDAWTGGGAIAAWETNMRIEGSDFTYNTASKTFGRGGAFYILNKKANFVMNRLDYNQAYDGGAIWARGQNRYVWLFINESSFSNNVANRSGGAVWNQRGVVMIDKSEFNQSMSGTIGTHYLTLPSGGGALFMLYSIIAIKRSCFCNSETDSDGGALRAVSCKARITDSRFKNNTAYNEGGVIHMLGIVDVSKSEFHSNTAKEGGALLIHPQNSANITLSVFVGNVASNEGGAVSTYLGSTVNIEKSGFSSNAAEDGGALHVMLTATVNISNSVFGSNEAFGDGGAIETWSTIKMNIVNSTFYSNTADRGGAITTQSAELMTLNNCDFRENAAKNGIIVSSRSQMVASESLTFSYNVGSLFLYGSNLSIIEGSLVTVANNSSPHKLDSMNIVGNLQEGGFITAFQSNITLNGTYIIMGNNVENGGAIHATQSKVFVYGDVKVANNTAEHTGGGFYLFQSELNCMLSSSLEIIDNSATEKGGGIHAISSILQIDVESLVRVIINYAKLGGGICLEINAKVYILKQYNNYALKALPLNFFANSADYGGAVYIADDTNSAMCASTSHRGLSALTECSIQVLALYNGKVKNILLKNVNFTGNRAYVIGPSLFGGLLDRCTISPFAEINLQKNLTEYRDGASYFNLISTISESINSTTHSHPVQLCFCRNGQPDYELKSINVTVKKGETFTVSLVAVDQVNHTLNATVQNVLSSNLGGLGEDQTLQNTTKDCTNLSYSVFSPHESEQLTLFANGPCKNAELSLGRITINFLPCSCPIGFEPDATESTTCICKCDSQLQHFITECHQQSRMLVRKDSFWISYYNSTSASLSGYNYLIYSNCPLDYCQPSTINVYIDLNTEQGSDAQCNFNRTGTLCGRCLPGLSLSLGSSLCIQCPSIWPLLLVVILTAAFLAGIFLVSALLFLNITVATGTINGIIFYANIVNANKSTFYPFERPNFVTVFIAWLNLEVGIDTCFFEQMDTYWKMLLQLAFPTYIIFLVVMIILISERSTKFARLIGRKNPVATLDTLILLSYAKLLQTIIDIFSFAILKYPGGRQDVVWLPDGTVSFFTGKHIVLFLIAVLVLLAGVAYTALLFSWQWLIYYQNKKLLKWVKYHRFYLFLEPYHAPYVRKHRYWTGLLLILRVVLYIASALNVSRAPGLELLITGVVMVSLLLVKGTVGMNGLVYRKWPVDVLETISYVNITVLCLATFYTLEADKDQTPLAYVSGTLTFILLLVVLAYHVWTVVCAYPVSKILKKWRIKKHEHIVDSDTTTYSVDYHHVDDDQETPPTPTVSWVEPPSCDEHTTDSM